MNTLLKFNLVMIFLFLLNACSNPGNEPSTNMIIPGESIGSWKLGAEVESKITEDGVYIYADATKEVFAIYTENVEYEMLDGSFQIGSLMTDVQKVHGVGSINVHDAQLIGKKLVAYDGFFVGVEDGVVKGIGVSK